MKKPLLFSRLLQFAIVLSFFLPFFFVGCEGGKTDESAATTDSLAVDTTIFIPADTLNSKDSVSLTNNTTGADSISPIQKTDTLKPKEEKEPDYLSIKIAQEYPWTKSFLYSKVEDPTFDGFSFTGVALIINTLEYFSFLCILLALLLIVLCLIIKFIDQLATRTHLLLNLLAILFLFLYVPGWHYRSQVGFQLCMTLLIITTALDIYRLLQNRSKKLY